MSLRRYSSLIAVLIAGLVLGQAGSGRASHSDPFEHHACVTEKDVEGGTQWKIKRLVSDPDLCKPGKELEKTWPEKRWAEEVLGDDATPSVRGLSLLSVCAISGPLTITDLEGSVPGQIVTLIMKVDGICVSSTTLADGGNFQLAGSFTGGVYDSLTLARDTFSATWVEVSRSDNS